MRRASGPTPLRSARGRWASSTADFPVAAAFRLAGVVPNAQSRHIEPIAYFISIFWGVLGTDTLKGLTLFVLAVIVLAGTIFFWFLRFARGSLATLALGLNVSLAIVVIGAIIGAFLLGGAVL